jgi:hypothetical protein
MQLCTAKDEAVSDIDRSSFGEFAELMQSAVDGKHGDIREIAQLGMRIFNQHEELEDHEEDGWELESLWFDVIEAGISQLLSEPSALGNSDLMDAILLLSKYDSHLLCLILAEDVDRSVIDQSVLKKISNAQPCGHDTGRSESCIGWQIRLAIHPNTPMEVLSALHDTNFHDQDSVRWALAMNPSSPSELLSTYSESTGSGWRKIGEIEEYGISGVSINEVGAQIQSFIRWAVAGNPSFSQVEKEELSKISRNEIQDCDFADVDILALAIRTRALSTILVVR